MLSWQKDSKLCTYTMHCLLCTSGISFTYHIDKLCTREICLLPVTCDASSGTHNMLNWYVFHFQNLDATTRTSPTYSITIKIMKLFKLLTSCAIVHVVFAQAGLQEFKLFNEELNSRSLIARGDGQWNSSLSTNTTTSSSMRTTSTNSTHVSSTSSTWPSTTSSSAS